MFPTVLLCLLLSLLVLMYEPTVQLNANLSPAGKTSVWNLYLRVWVRVQARTHATNYLLWVISTNDKNTSLSSSILRVSLLVYVYTHIVKSQLRTFYFAY